MGVGIERLLAAIRDYSARVDDPPEMTYTLVAARTGGFFEADDTGMGLVRLRELRGEDTTDAREDWLRRWLNSVVSKRGISEAALVANIVRDVDAFIEESVEDHPQRRKRNREELAVIEAELADPTQVDLALAKINASRRLVHKQFGFPLEPEVTRDTIPDYLASIRHMQERFVPPPTLEALREGRARLDAWREVVVPILQESPEH